MVFLWSNACNEVFKRLKALLTQAPILAFPNFACNFRLETDAPGQELGAILSQEHEDGTVLPIAYASWMLQPHEHYYGATELEALGVVWAVRHLHQYLYGHCYHVFTDHEALKSLLNSPHPSGKLLRWGLSIQELDLHIHCKSGRKNEKADTLSRSLVLWSPPKKSVNKLLQQWRRVSLVFGKGQILFAQCEDATLSAYFSCLED